MDAKQTSTISAFTRCAVCKIDLKGKFVYVDDRVEDLLGYTKEELFGQQIHDYIDHDSTDRLEELLVQRNHYETFYDVTNLTFLGRDKSARTARTTVSLNFIAGNPVNFQLIIDPSVVSQTESEAAVPPSRFRLFTEKLMAVSDSEDWKPVLSAICQIYDASHACLYSLRDGKPELHKVSGNENSAEMVYTTVPDTMPLHERLAQSGGEYSFVNGHDVQKVVEESGTAPTEWITRLEDPDREHFLLRVIFDNYISHQVAADAIKDLKLGLLLRRRLSARTEDGEDLDIRFVIGFLDSLGIPAFLTNEEGAVIGYNPVTLTFMDKGFLDGQYVRVLDMLKQFNEQDFERTILDYMNSDFDPRNSVDLRVRMRLSETAEAMLTVLKLGDSKEDLSACFVFAPHNLSPKP